MFMGILSFVMMTLASTLSLFAVSTYYVWKRKWATTWQVIPTVCFGIVLAFDIYFLSAILLSSFVFTSWVPWMPWNNH